MSTELDKSAYNIQPALSQSDFNELASATRFLPRVQLQLATSKYVQQRELQKKFGLEAGFYALIYTKDNVENLGDEFDCLPFQVRARATDISDQSNVITSFNKNTQLFKDIAERSKTRDSGCMYGPEFLLWLPKQGKFATMFFGNATARNAAPELWSLLNQHLPATISSRFIESSKGGWYGPVITLCRTPFDLPDPELVAEQAHQFSHPPEQETESADTAVEVRVR